MRKVDGLSPENLLEKYHGFVRSIALQLKSRLAVRVELDELIQDGRIGLLEAADRFDSKQGVSFKTFAYYRIRGAMYDGLRKMEVIRRKRNSDLQFEIAATEFLRDEAVRMSPEPRPKSLKDDINEVYGLISGLVPIFLLTSDAMDRLEAADSGKSPEAQVTMKQEKEMLREVMKGLPDRERRLMEYHYYQDMTLEQAAGQLGLSKSWASRLHAKILNKLKTALKKRK